MCLRTSYACRLIPARCAVIVALAITGCGVSLDVPDNTLIQCRTNAECPRDLPVCAATMQCVTRDILDEDGPALVAISSEGATTLILTFSLPLLVESAEATGSYVIEGLSVTTASLRADARSVLLETQAQVPALTYTLRVPGVRDVAGRYSPTLSQTFRGFGIVPDLEAPEQILPAPDSATAMADVTFTWTGRAAAKQYTIEIARDSEFTTRLTSQTVDAPVTTSTVALAITGIVYWRVRSDIETAAASGRRLRLFRDTVYVACDDGAACAGGSGTDDAPFHTIADAVALADTLGIRTIDIAPAAQPYVESILIREPHAIVCNGATINSANSLGVFFIVDTADVEVRHCVLHGQSASRAITVTASNDVSLQRITADTSGVDDLVVIEMNGSERVLLADSTITTPNNPEHDAALVRVRSSELEVQDSALTGGSAGASVAIHSERSTLIVTGSQITAGDAVLTFSGSGVSTGIFAERSFVSLFRSTVSGGFGGSAANGLDLEKTSLSLIESNAFGTQKSTSAKATALHARPDAGTVDVVNSVLIGSSSTGPGVALDLRPLESNTRVLYTTLFGSAPGGDTTTAPVSIATPEPMSCNQAATAFINSAVVSNSPRAVETLQSDDDETKSSLLIRGCVVVAAGGSASVQVFEGTIASLSCGGSSSAEFITAPASTVFPRFASGDYRPANAYNFKRGVALPSGCSPLSCSAVAGDMTGAMRVSSPPSAGAYDLP